MPHRAPGAPRGRRSPRWPSAARPSSRTRSLSSTTTTRFARSGGGDGGQASEVHQERAVAVERHHPAVGARQRDPEGDRAGEAHAAPRVEVERAIAVGEQLVRGVPQAGDDRFVRQAAADDADGVEAGHERPPSDRRRQAAGEQAGRAGTRVPNARVAAARTGRRARPRRGRSTGAGCRGRRERGPTARPIGTWAEFHSPGSPRMLTISSGGDLVGEQQGAERVERVADPARLHEQRGAPAAEVEAGRDADRFLLPRGQQRLHVGVIRARAPRGCATAGCRARRRRAGTRRPTARQPPPRPTPGSGLPAAHAVRQPVSGPARARSARSADPTPRVRTSCSLPGPDPNRASAPQGITAGFERHARRPPARRPTRY